MSESSGRKPIAGQLSKLYSRRQENVTEKYRAPQRQQTPCFAVGSVPCIGSGSPEDNPYTLLSRVSLVNFPSMYIFLFKKNSLLFHCFSVPENFFWIIILWKWISNCLKQFVWHFLLIEKSAFLWKKTFWRYLNFQTASYPTVLLLIEDLWREGNSILRLFFTRDILSHPFPVVFITCYVHLLKINLVGF